MTVGMPVPTRWPPQHEGCFSPDLKRRIAHSKNRQHGDTVRSMASLSSCLKVLLSFLSIEDIRRIWVKAFFPTVNNPFGHDPVGEPVG